MIDNSMLAKGAEIPYFELGQKKGQMGISKVAAVHSMQTSMALIQKDVHLISNKNDTVVTTSSHTFSTCVKLKSANFIFQMSPHIFRNPKNSYISNNLISILNKQLMGCETLPCDIDHDSLRIKPWHTEAEGD